MKLLGVDCILFMKFVDELDLRLCGGHGGRGIVSFAREKYRPRGGPDGGNGGDGGDVYIQTNPALPTLGKLLRSKVYHAGKGGSGRGRKQSGERGKDLELEVPVGTEILDLKSRELLADLESPGASYLAAKGGRGGLGNYNFSTSTKQKPEHAQPGEKGGEILLHLRLKLLADAGLVGLPNAGKSTLLAALSRKRPRIADYPFTTLTPNIGLLENRDYRRLYLADIPGIIAKASEGAGLGLSFLKHIERVSLTIYLLDASRFDFEAEIKLLQEELYNYKPALLERPALVLVNKHDLMDYDPAMTGDIRKRLLSPKLWPSSKIPEVFFISAKNKKGLDLFLEKLFSLFPQKTQAEKALSP